MAKSMLVGVNGTARKVGRLYVGVNGITRRVKKAYVGINGLARQFYSSGEVSYRGTIAAISPARFGIGGASIGDYALFSCGNAVSDWSAATEVYDTTLTKKNATASSLARMNAAGVANNNFAFFGGGLSGSGNNIANGRTTVNAYNASLTRSTPANLSSGVSGSATTRLGDYAIFAGGGYYGAASNPVAYVDTYNNAATKKKAQDLSNARMIAGASVGKYALFAGNDGIVDVYDESLTRVNSAQIPPERAPARGYSFKDFALFPGANPSAFNASLTKISPTFGRTIVAGVELNNLGISGYSDTTSKSITVIDGSSLTLETVLETTSIARTGGGMATVGNYAIYAGGTVNPTPYNMVDAFEYKED